MLFDQNVPKPLLRALTGHSVTRAARMGWGELVNGELIAAVEAAGFDVPVTADKQWRYQQNLTNRTIAIVVLPTNQWPDLCAHLVDIAAEIDRVVSGAYLELDLPRAAPARCSPPEQAR